MATIKRQRRADHGAAASVEAPKLEGATMSIPASKKHKTRASAKVKEEAVVVIKAENIVSLDGGNEQMVAAQAAVAVVEEEGRYSCSEGSVWWDEQMSWGSIWSPLWDVELMGEAHYGLFCDHGVWDDDIWGLRTTVPISNR